MLRRLLDAGAKSCSSAHGLHAIAVDARGPDYEGGIVTRIDSIPLGIVVNREAERFYDEGEELWPKRYATWGRLIVHQPDQLAFSVFDTKSLGHFMSTIYPPYKADSLEALAGQCRLDPESLRQTVEGFNASVIQGTFDPQVLDDCHTRGLDLPKSHWALPINRPPSTPTPCAPGSPRLPRRRG